MTDEFHHLLATNRQLKMRCLELATSLCAPNKSPDDIIKCADTLYNSLPLNAETSHSAKAAKAALDRAAKPKSAEAAA